MTKAEMIDLIAARCEVTKPRAADALDTLLRNLADDLAGGERVKLPHIGTLVAGEPSAARRGRNPRTGEAVEVKPFRRIRFRAVKQLKARLAALPAAAE